MSSCETSIFLHLVIYRHTNFNCIEVICSCLPGEWRVKLLAKHHIPHHNIFLRPGAWDWCIADFFPLKASPCTRQDSRGPVQIRYLLKLIVKLQSFVHSRARQWRLLLFASWFRFVIDVMGLAQERGHWRHSIQTTYTPFTFLHFMSEHCCCLTATPPFSSTNIEQTNQQPFPKESSKQSATMGAVVSCVCFCLSVFLDVSL